jgi:hypothetical protein
MRTKGTENLFTYSSFCDQHAARLLHHAGIDRARYDPAPGAVKTLAGSPDHAKRATPNVLGTLLRSDPQARRNELDGGLGPSPDELGREVTPERSRVVSSAGVGWLTLLRLVRPDDGSSRSEVARPGSSPGTVEGVEVVPAWRSASGADMQRYERGWDT